MPKILKEADTVKLVVLVEKEIQKKITDIAKERGFRKQYLLKMMLLEGLKKYETECKK